MGIFAASSIFSQLSNLLSSLAVTIFMAFLCLERFTRISTLASRVLRAPTRFGPALNSLLNQALFGHRPGPVPSPFDGPEVGECVVCLCEIEKREEVTELKCQHKFHRVCLQQWMNHRHYTCPLCRGYLAPPMYEETGHVEVVYFRSFSLFSDDDETDRWWLR